MLIIKSAERERERERRHRENRWSYELGEEKGDGTDARAGVTPFFPGSGGIGEERGSESRLGAQGAGEPGQRRKGGLPAVTVW